MTQGNGNPNTSETRARLAGLSVLDRALAEQRAERKPQPVEPTPSRSLRVEAGMRAIEEAEQEREALRGALQSAEADLRGVRAELDVVNLAHTRAMTEMDRHQRERDEAVDRRAKADALLEAVLTLLQKHRGPTLSEELRADPRDYGADD